ncbi:MAG: hypothetical protein V4738_00810 [Pseudomonadota bacterium]
MNTSKILTSTVAAAALVGAIGLAYAQTSDPSLNPQGTDNAATTQNQSGSVPAPTSLDNSVQTPTPMSADSTSFQGERPAQADRN